MTVVSQEDLDAMIRLRAVIDGKPMPLTLTETQHQHSAVNNRMPIDLPGPGVASRQDVDAMASVLSRLNKLSNNVVDTMLTESVTMPEVADALTTERTLTGVKIGRYQIMIKEDSTRTAGKQFYSIYNSLTDDTIAYDISLYETAISVVRLLNGGKFANSPEIRKLFECDESYSSHKVDAIRFRRKQKKSTDPIKRDIYESRYQASLDRAMSAKRQLKVLISDAH